jgi:5,6,7,8-tetrahydromethanopterin hydro-lyase
VTAEVADLSRAAGAVGAKTEIATDWTDVENWGTCVMQFDDGTRGVAYGSDNLLGGMQSHLTILGSDHRFECSLSPMDSLRAYAVHDGTFGDGNEVAHVDLIMGPRGSAAETAFCNGLVNNKDGFTSLLAVVAPNLLAKPNTLMFNKVTIKGAKQAVQMFGPAQRAVAMAVADSVEDGTIPADEADDLFICVGVFIHWLAEDDTKIQDYNYQATKEAIQRAVAGEPRAADVVAKKGTAEHPFAAHK